MLHKRLVAVLTVKNGIVVQSLGFQKYLPVGRLDIAVEFLSRWGIDEISILDIDATPERRQIDIGLIEKSIKKNFAPLAVGGGIHEIDDMRRLNHLGAEKVVINAIAVIEPEIIEQAAKIFGSQFVVVSIDVKLNNEGSYTVHTHSGQIDTGKDPISWAKEASELGAGEILITSIDRDGTQTGYDLELIKKVVAAVSVPVIACGGVGHPRHFLEGFEAGAFACAAGNFFHFNEHSPIIAKRYLQDRGLDIRIDTYATYAGATLLDSGRLAKQSDQYLENLRFEILPDEKI